MTETLSSVPSAENVPEDVWASWSPALSPASDRVAFVSDRDGEPHVWVSDLPGGTPRRLSLDGLRAVSVTWSPLDGWLAVTVAPPGASRSEVWLVRPDGDDLRLAAGGEGATAMPAPGCLGWTADGQLLVTEIAGPGRVLLVDPEDGSRRVLAEDRLLVGVDLSRDGRLLLVRRGTRTARSLSVLDLATGAEQALLPGEGSTDAGCFAPDGRSVWVRSDVGRDLAALVVVPLDDGEPRVFARPDAELEEVGLSPDGATAVLTWNLDGGRSAVSVLTAAGERLLPTPREVVHTPRLSADGRLVALAAEGPTDPRGVWLLPVDGSAPEPVSSLGRGLLAASTGASVTGRDPGTVVAPRLLRLRSPDGTRVSGWWYAPAGDGPWPTMLHLHGGPEAQERPVYNSLFQSLVQRGVAVFAPNVRGSSGFGRAFVAADDGARRYGAFDDVAACVAHLLDEGLATPGRVGVMGRSYGGYLTLAMLVRRPDLFRVGIDVCGMSDLETFYANTEPWIASAAVSKYGDPVSDREMLRDLSPIHRIDELRAPLLVVQGAEDTNVPVSEAEQVVAALARLGREHRYLLFPGEGHELLSSRARVTFVRESVDWVLTHL